MTTDRFLECVGGPLCGDELAAIDALNRIPVWVIPAPYPSSELTAYQSELDMVPDRADVKLVRPFLAKVSVNGQGRRWVVMKPPSQSVSCVGPLSPREWAVQELTPAFEPFCHPNMPPHAIGAYMPVVRVTRATTWHALGWHPLRDDDELVGV